MDFSCLYVTSYHSGVHFAHWMATGAEQKKCVGLRSGYIRPVNHRGLVSQGVPLHTKYGPWGLECYRFLQWMSILRLSVQAIRTGKISALSDFNFFSHLFQLCSKECNCSNLRKDVLRFMGDGLWVMLCLYRFLLTSYVSLHSFLHCCYCVVEAPWRLLVPGCSSCLQGEELTRKGVTCPEARLSI